MKKTAYFAGAAVFAAALFLLSGCGQGGGPEIRLKSGSLKLYSPDFRENSLIDSEFTCEGKNISPALSWEGAPAGTKSFALTMKDPDAPGGNFDHWLIAYIPYSASGIPKGGPVPGGSLELANGMGNSGYTGPCPPSGTHRYIFTLYALDTEKLAAAAPANISETASSHAIAEARLTGLYKKIKQR